MKWRIHVGALALVFAAQACLAQQLTLTPLQPGGIYAVGEKAGWEVTTSTPAAGQLSYTI